MTLAENFYEKFISYANCGNSSDYSDNSIWTDLTKCWIKKSLKVIISEIEFSHEYYRIDTIGWIQRKTELDTGNTNLVPYLWDLVAAVEHENDSKEWLDEVCKLAYIRCPLRVVIGYGIEQLDDKIDVVKEILAKTNAFTDDEQEFLIILGKHKNEFVQGSDNFTNVIIKRCDIINEK